MKSELFIFASKDCSHYLKRNLILYIRKKKQNSKISEPANHGIWSILECGRFVLNIQVILRIDV